MKVYNKKEVGAILKKASQNSHKEDFSDAVGLTMDELEQIASDVGIEPGQMTKAAAEIATTSSTSSDIWGGPFSFNESVVLDHEISSGEWEDMLLSIRAFFKSKGDVAIRESVMEWSSPWGTTNSAQVTARKENGTTKVSVLWNGPVTALPFYVPVPLVTIASLFIATDFLNLGPILGLSFVLAMAGLTFLTGRRALRRSLQKGFARLHELTVGFENTAEKTDALSSTQVVPASETSTVVSEPILGLEELDSQNDEQENSIERDRSRA
jgi:hypothetical protein